jgi:UTP--glucose-1-phosphate uridylyltransferase
MIRKAVITAAGKGTRQYPATNSVQKELFPLVDRDGIAKPTIQIIAEQALAAGIEEICIVVQPGEDEQFKNHFRGLIENEKKSFANKKWGLAQSQLLDKLNHAITYVYQTVQEGYGHAVYCAKDWVGAEPFLLMLGDHLYISHSNESCVTQLINAFRTYQQTIYSVKQTPAERLYLFGTVAGESIGENPAAYQLTRIVEKPAVSFAQKNLVTPGLPENTFLTFFGMHVLKPEIFEILGAHIQQNVREKGEIQLTTAQAELCQRDGAIGVEIEGERLDMGTPLGYLETQTALAMNGVFADEFSQFVKKMMKMND